MRKVTRGSEGVTTEINDFNVDPESQIECDANLSLSPVTCVTMLRKSPIYSPLTGPSVPSVSRSISSILESFWR